MSVRLALDFWHMLAPSIAPGLSSTTFLDSLVLVRNLHSIEMTHSVGGVEFFMGEMGGLFSPQNR